MPEKIEHDPNAVPPVESEVDQETLKTEYARLNTEWVELEGYSSQVKRMLPQRLPAEVRDNFDKFMSDLGNIRSRQLKILTRQAEIERLVFQR